jgi:hypothetical protein
MQDKELTSRQRYWLDHVLAWKASGNTMSAYAEDQGFAVRAMYDGKKALVRKGVLPRSIRRTSSPRFERIEVIDSSSENPWRIALPNGAVVEFPALLDEQTLNTVLKSAAQI